MDLNKNYFNFNFNYDEDLEPQHLAMKSFYASASPFWNTDPSKQLLKLKPSSSASVAAYDEDLEPQHPVKNSSSDASAASPSYFEEHALDYQYDSDPPQPQNSSAAPSKPAVLTFLHKKTAEVPEKRGRGRPRKNPAQEGPKVKKASPRKTSKSTSDNKKFSSLSFKCSICHEVPSDCKLMNTSFGHVAHEVCMTSWLSTDGQRNKLFKTCPGCGSDFKEKDLNPLYI